MQIMVFFINEMGDIFSYIEIYELIGFFSGYALIYSLLKALNTSHSVINRILPRLPIAYALTGTFYIANLLRKFYLQWSLFGHISFPEHLYLTLWGLVSLIFWLPATRKISNASLYHSLVFFYFILRDIVLHLLGKAEREQISNNMSMLTISLLVNVSTILLLLALTFLLSKKRY